MYSNKYYYLLKKIYFIWFQKSEYQTVHSYTHTCQAALIDELKLFSFLVIKKNIYTNEKIRCWAYYLVARTKCPPRPHHEMRPVGEIVRGLRLITTQAFVWGRLTNGFLGVLLSADIQGCNRTSPNPFPGKRGGISLTLYIDGLQLQDWIHELQQERDSLLRQICF